MIFIEFPTSACQAILLKRNESVCGMLDCFSVHLNQKQAK